MEKKIKIVVFGMVVALLVTFLPFRQTEIYAGISENAYQIVFFKAFLICAEFLLAITFF